MSVCVCVLGGVPYVNRARQKTFLERLKPENETKGDLSIHDVYIIDRGN